MFKIVFVVFAVIRSLHANCPAPLIDRCGATGDCDKTCRNWNISPLCFVARCRDGCFCPNAGYIQSHDSNYNIQCIPDTKPDQCYCPDGQVFTLCGRPGPPLTCNCPKPKPGPTVCVPKCQCPKKTPIWHNGKCISEKQCICCDKCATSGCDRCNKCKCKKGKPKACTKTGCPDLGTKQGLDSLEKQGCWRLCPSGEQCIFYSPCPDNYGNNGCNPPSGPFVNHRFCRGCEKCRCDAGHPLCEDNTNCTIEFDSNFKKDGCWKQIKDKCHFVYPCPEKDKCCECLDPGTKSCKACRKCEIVHGLKICKKNTEHCPNPLLPKNHCRVWRTYPGVPQMCYEVSPCPSGQPPCPHGLMKIDIKKDFCYMCDKEKDHCELVAPCPGTATCCKDDIICDECRECTCKEGKISCSKEKCGNPVPTACWMYESRYTCVLQSPCPENAVYNSEAFCLEHPRESFCNAKDCNVCTCDGPGVEMSCTERFCVPTTASKGAYAPLHGVCLWQFPPP